MQSGVAEKYVIFSETDNYVNHGGLLMGDQQCVHVCTSIIWFDLKLASIQIA